MPARAERRRSEPRSFHDEAGRAWQVYELRRDGPDGASVILLVFESASAIRCVRRYPADWRELSPAMLEALSWSV